MVDLHNPGSHPGPTGEVWVNPGPRFNHKRHLYSMIQLDSQNFLNWKLPVTQRLWEFHTFLMSKELASKDSIEIFNEMFIGFYGWLFTGNNLQMACLMTELKAFYTICRQNGWQKKHLASIWFNGEPRSREIFMFVCLQREDLSCDVTKIGSTPFSD